MGKTLRLTAISALFTLAACASGGLEQDIRAEHLYACEAYTTALESAVVWKEAGAMSAEQVEILRTVERETTPLCMTPEPSATGAELVRRAFTRLDHLLIELALQEDGA